MRRGEPETDLEAADPGSRVDGRRHVVRLDARDVWTTSLAELWAHREVLYFLVVRNLKVRYRQTVLGAAWPATFISDATLTSLVAELRAGLGDSAVQPRFVRTVHRFGYAFCGTVRDESRSRRRPLLDVTCWVIWEAGQVALREGENVLGRDRDVAVWFDATDVSRRHARIVIAGGRAILEDLDSKNGTYVRGARITAPWPLEDGDQIGVGSAVVTFRVAAGGASTESRHALESDR